MTKYFSIAQYPGSTGQFYYTKFFDYYKVNASYTPIGTSNFIKSYLHLISEKAAGISISMPFKKEIIEYLDFVDPFVANNNSCNTVKLVDGKSYGYNADLAGIIHVSNFINNQDSISILGNGCIANMFANHLKNYNIDIFSRNKNNWDYRHKNNDVIINCTSFGTSSSDSPIDYIPENTKLIIDLAIKDNKLKELCANNNIFYVPGLVFYKHQFLKQFEIYTNISADPDYFDNCIK